MHNNPIRLTLIITTPKDGKRKYHFRQRTDRLYDGNTAGENGRPFEFTIAKSLDYWAFGEAIPLPIWLKNIESEFIFLFSAATCGEVQTEAFNN